MLHAGLDLSRKRLDFHVLDEAGRDGRGRRRTARRRRSARPRRPPFAPSAAGAGGDRVDDRRPLRPRPARARRLGGRDRRRAEGEGTGAAGLQDRPDRRLGAGRALPARAGAGDLAARPDGAGRARAGPLPTAPRPPSLQPEATGARHSAHARQALSSLRPVRRLAVASCSRDSRCPSRGRATSKLACA